MAQSGYTPILIYASGTASNVPLAANLTSSASGAELALNYADGKLYFKNSLGVVTLLAGSGGGGPAAGSNTQIQFNNSGVFGASANLTWSGTVLSTTGLTATGAITLNTTTNNQSYTTTGAGTITISSGTAGSINNMNIGATTAGTGTFTSLSDSGNLTFTGTGNRITGDFSNATLSSRVMFQTSTANSATVISAIPNGTSLSAQLQLFNNADPTNAGRLQLNVNSTEAQIFSSISGTGTYLPMTFYTGGSERMRIDSSGNVGIGTSSPSYKLDVANSDAQIYGVRVGRGPGAVSTNTVLGSGVLSSSTFSFDNTAIGYRAGYPITTGNGNIFIGPDTGFGLQSTASYNTVIGSYALNASASNGPTGAVVIGASAGYYLKNADYSVVIGYQAGAFGGFYQVYSTVAIGYRASQYNYGAYNTAIGYQANNGNAVNNSGSNNTAVGYQALFSNTANYNTAVGSGAGYSTTSGASNISMGSGAAYSNTTGSYNIAIGAQNLYNNQTNSNNTSVGHQSQNQMRADGNTSIGYYSLYGSPTLASNTGGYNTVIGYQAAYNAFTTGTYNTIIGANAGYSLTTGSQNVLIGSSSTASTAAGYAITTGQYNVVIGPYTGNSGGLDIRTASNFVVFADGQSNIRQVFNSSGVSLTAQGAPASITTTATLTGAQVLGGLINTTGTTYTVTMPLGTSLDTALVGCPTDFAFNFSVINTASGTITMAVNTGITSLGSLSISTGTSATYRVRKTAANTFVMYRI